VISSDRPRLLNDAAYGDTMAAQSNCKQPGDWPVDVEVCKCFLLKGIERVKCEDAVDALTAAEPDRHKWKKSDYDLVYLSYSSWQPWHCHRYEKRGVFRPN
jgi:hypothetical protein